MKTTRLVPYFPDGFAPAGIELESISVNGVAADWGWQGKNETALRIACALEAGGKCEFEMQYYVLLGSNCAFLGQGDLDVRLSGFYFIPGIYLSDYEEFLTSAPLSYAQWLQSDAADYSVTLAIPDAYLPAGTGDQALVQTENRHLYLAIHGDERARIRRLLRKTLSRICRRNRFRRACSRARATIEARQKRR